MKVAIEVSARHMHLSKEDLKTLFGTYDMPVRNRLSQKGEFASDFTVEVVGPKNRLKNVRVLGPTRDKTQLEISRTDSYFIGINAPLANSGEGKGDVVRIIGRKGEITKDVAMVAKRHFHSSPQFAKKYSLKHGEFVSMHVPGLRSVMFDNILIRIDQKFTDIVHLDTDEANAAEIRGICYGQLIKRKK